MSLIQLQEVTDALSRRLARSVTIDDRRMRVLTYSVAEHEVDRVRTDAILRRSTPSESQTWLRDLGVERMEHPTLIPGNPELDQLPRVCAPIRHRAHLLGFLWVLDPDGSITGDELSDIGREAGFLGPLLRQQGRELDTSIGHREELVRGLLSPRPKRRSEAAAELLESGGFVVDAGVAVCVVEVDGVPSAAQPHLLLAEALERACRRLSPRHRLTFTRSNGGVLVLSPGSAGRDGLREVGEGVVTHLERSLGGSSSVRVGFGDPVETLVDVWTGSRQARSAIRIGRLIPGLGPVTWYEDLGVYRILALLTPEQLAPDVLTTGVRNLLAEGNPVMLETLETYLDLGCDATEAAAALQIHRTTMYYRLSRIEATLGITLSDGQERVALHLGLKVARLLGPTDQVAARERS
jgi:hypothetical protein